MDSFFWMKEEECKHTISYEKESWNTENKILNKYKMR